MNEELESGDSVTASVRLLRPLAQGGMGMVWVAEHLVLDTEVVVKLMTKEVQGHAGAAARFAREAAVAAAVKSPHVVQVFDSGVTEGGTAFIVMELLDGHDLGAHLTARGRMAPSEVAIIMSQLGKALAKAHRVGVIHRDLKPDNIFLCEVEGGEPFVKLLDFGTARDELRAPHATTVGQLIGTPFYMSPEQILGEPIDARTDIWSLGVVAFEALTGVRPFDGATVGGVTLAIHTTKPRMTDVIPELPETLDHWFARACARDPADRFQTVRAATDALVHAIAGEAWIPDSAPGSHDDLTPGVLLPSADGSARHPVMTASAATSLSSTLASSRHTERRTMMWLAGFVVAGAVVAMIAVLSTGGGDRRPAPAVSLSDPSPSISAVTSAAVTPKASAAPPPVASVVAPPVASGLPSLTFAPSSPSPSPFPFASPSPSASASASAKGERAKPPPPPLLRPLEPIPAAPSPSPSPSPPPAPSPPPPASTLAPSPHTLPTAEPPPGPVDLRELLPPPTPGP
jgi:eukaryotic-like serine/threonine-protein kinase